MVRPKRRNRGADGATGPPCPAAVEPPDYLRRLEALALTFRQRQARGEGFGPDLGLGRGFEFVGYRPYRAGEDARGLDHLLLARLGKPFVRQLQPEAHSQVTLLLDSSASMAVGPPGKWQTAVEFAAAFGRLYSSVGARVEWVFGRQGRGLERLSLARPTEWPRCKDQLFELKANGGAGLADLLPALSRVGTQAILIGDGFDVTPAQLQPYLRASTSWSLLRILSEWETTPPFVPTLWLDPEKKGDPVASGGGLDVWNYLQLLAADDAAWQAWSALYRVRYRVYRAGTPLEDVLLDRSPSGRNLR